MNEDGINGDEISQGIKVLSPGYAEIDVTKFLGLGDEICHDLSHMWYLMSFHEFLHTYGLASIHRGRLEVMIQWTDCQYLQVILMGICD